MRKIVFMLLFVNVGIVLCGQNNAKDTSWKKIYRETATRINDLVHTKLDVRFDFDKSYMYGKAWITLKPHFYSTDSLTLDAKGMDLHKVAMVNGNTMKDLKYDYDGWHIKIMLDKTYKNSESYTVFIDYTSKPNEVKVQGSAAITDAKGLYFINPQGTEKNKPTEIWTQGETEANSVWMPTIDKPNQKTTDEIYMTIPDKYVTLSNGLLISKKKNTDGTRTDYWKMDLPHAPYLIFMGIGDFAVIKDSYKGKEVSYYVDKDYASVARKIFGLTPEMIAFFSKVTGVDYPWQKYAQMTGHDYVSGAMENTTATLHSDAAQQDARQLTDGNRWEDDISHELFHQWFGDYVTTESWSNITMNETFANYSEMLWREYKYGKDAGDAKNYSDMQLYLRSKASSKKDLVRFYYNDKEDVFDLVSYHKGGRILNMLRSYVGDSAFFKALNLYLNTYKFKSTEAQELRLVFEDVTGKDLNWYWNQWYYGAGNPDLDINYSYDDASKKVRVIVNQLQPDKIFKLPVSVDVYNGANKTRYQVWAENKADTFYFNASQKPDLINFDGNKVLLCTKKENKTLDEYIFQYKNAGTYVDRREAIEFALKNQQDPKAIEFLKLAMKDPFDGLRRLVIDQLDLKKDNVKQEMESLLVAAAKNDPKRLVQASAITRLGEYKKAEYISLFKKAVNDSSYTVAGSALEALAAIDTAAAFNEAVRLSVQTAKGKLSVVIPSVIIKAGDPSKADIPINAYEKLESSQIKFELLQPFADIIAKIKDLSMVKKGVDAIVAFRDDIPTAFKQQTDLTINEALKELAKKKKEQGLQDQVDYIISKLPEDQKKGF